MIREWVKKILNEHREDIYRCFQIFKVKIKVFSHKYMARALQEDIKKLYEENKKLEDISKKEHEFLKQYFMDMQKESFAIYRKIETIQGEFVDTRNIISEMQEVIRQKETDRLTYVEKIIEEVRGNTEKISLLEKQLEINESVLKKYEEVLSEFGDGVCEISEDIKGIQSDLEVVTKNHSIETENNALLKKIIGMSEEYNKKIESKLYGISNGCLEKQKLLKKIEFENKILLPNSMVHLSAHVRIGNAGDNVLVPALRDSISKVLDKKINWCHKPVHDVLEDDAITAINMSTGVLIGGGGLFLRDTNANEISGWQWPCSLNMLDKIKVPIYMMGIGYNRFRGQADFEPYFKDNINEIVARCEFVGLRNHGSIRAIQQYLSEDLKEKVHFHPCATTVLSKLYRIPNAKNKESFIAVNCAFDRSPMRYGEKKEEIICTLARVLKKYSKDYLIKFYAHMQPDKEALPYFDKEGLKYEVVDLDNALSIDDFLRIYSEPALVLAMRGHAQMIPFGCGTPTLSIISHDKLQWFLEDIGHPEWGVEVLANDFELALDSKVSYMLNNTNLIRAEIEEAKDALWEITRENIKMAFNKNVEYLKSVMEEE